MSEWKPVATKADLETLDESEILLGYMEAERGDPEPGSNRGRAYWHGWRNRMADYGEIPIDAAMIQLVHELHPRIADMFKRAMGEHG